MNSSPTSKSPVVTRKKGDNQFSSLLLTPVASSSKDLAESGSGGQTDEHPCSLSNNDMEIDEYDYRTVTSVDRELATFSVPQSKSIGDIASGGATAMTTSGENNNDEDEDENDLAEIDMDNYSLGTFGKNKFFYLKT